LIQLHKSHKVGIKRCSPDPFHRAFRLVVHARVDILRPVDISEGVLGRIGVQVEELVFLEVFLGGKYLDALLFGFEAFHDEDCAALELGRVSLADWGFERTLILLNLCRVLKHLHRQYSHHKVVDSSAVALGQVVSVVGVAVSGLHCLHLALLLDHALPHQLVVRIHIEHYLE